jgi:hypothetical protein
MSLSARLAIVLLAGLTAPSAAGAQVGIGCNLLGPRHTCPPYLLYPPGQDLRLTVHTARHAPRKAEPKPAGINTLRELFAVLRACWRPPDGADAEPGMQISVRLSFNRAGYIIGAPRFTFVRHDVPERRREAYRRAVMESLERCEPLPLTAGLGGAIAGRPIAIRYVDDRKIHRIGA